MPTYDYHCESCEHDFSAFHKMSDPAPACPGCGGEVKKKVSAPAVHGATSGAQSTAAAPASGHGCSAGGCGCRH